MVRLEVVLETRDLGLKRGQGSSLLHSLLYTANCRYHRIRHAPRCGQPDEAGTVMGRVGVGGALSHKGGKTWEGEPRVA